MNAQTYATHRRYVPLYHYGLYSVLVLTFIGACVNLGKSWGDHDRLYSASLIVVLTGCMLFLLYYARNFALKAQDRAIRAEENLRHFVLTGKLLDSQLTMKQIVALRFAPDDEFIGLARRAAGERLAPDDIKKAIANWRGDYYRV